MFIDYSIDLGRSNEGTVSTDTDYQITIKLSGSLKMALEKIFFWANSISRLGPVTPARNRFIFTRIPGRHYSFSGVGLGTAIDHSLYDSFLAH